ncbi:uncharacterized protein LOC111079197 [Drosophila obscura]|uniref:uncharacterized protein LOC111079197 n=1 Tax=Drosophila obscura TaxID=7282 RepID=UPI000BA09B6F|nr:uncharacterized protein LOC111079197 [Drosophila obscura]
MKTGKETQSVRRLLAATDARRVPIRQSGPSTSGGTGGYRKVTIAPYKCDSKGMQAEIQPDLDLPVVLEVESQTAASDDILDRYESDASDLVRGLRRIDVGEDTESTESDADDTMVEVSLRNVPDTPADKPPSL